MPLSSTVFIQNNWCIEKKRLFQDRCRRSQTEIYSSAKKLRIYNYNRLFSFRKYNKTLHDNETIVPLSTKLVLEYNHHIIKPNTRFHIMCFILQLVCLLSLKHVEQSNYCKRWGISEINAFSPITSRFRQ